VNARGVEPKASSGEVLSGFLRRVVVNRLRARLGLRLEFPGLIAGLPRDAAPRCLEIGTGLGWGSLGLLRSLAPSLLIATDYDRAILPATRRFLHDEDADGRAHFCQADAKQLPFADQSFDLVLALYVIHHVRGARAAVAEISRVLRPGGRFVFADFLEPAWVSRLGTHHGAGAPTRADLEDALRACGLSVERRRGFANLTRLVARKG